MATSRDVLIELIELAKDGDEAGLASWNLPAGISSLLGKLVAVSREVQSLERIVARRESEEAELEQLLLGMLQQSGIATGAAASDQSADSLAPG